MNLYFTYVPMVYRFSCVFVGSWPWRAGYSVCKQRQVGEYLISLGCTLPSCLLAITTFVHAQTFDRFVNSTSHFMVFSLFRGCCLVSSRNGEQIARQDQTTAVKRTTRPNLTSFFDSTQCSSLFCSAVSIALFRIVSRKRYLT